MELIRRLVLTFKQIFLTPVSGKQHWGMILLIAVLFIFMPQQQPIDWDLNTEHFWSNGLAVYDYSANVYPPWGLILMLPYYLMTAAGARFFSVIVIGWLTQRRGWSLVRFLLIVLGPYFLVTLSKSNMDIFVFVFPILLWERAEDTPWQSLGRGLALSVFLLKPQGAILIWPYLLWGERHNWRGMIKPGLLVATIVLPISLIGSPPLILQWIDNLRNPTPQNIFYWSINNFSLSTFFNPFWAVMILLLAFLLLRVVMKSRGRIWSRDHTIASLFMASMFLSPYTSQQSFSSALAFLPSIGSYLFQLFILFVSFSYFEYLGYISLWVFSIGIVSMYIYQPATVAHEVEDGH